MIGLSGMKNEMLILKSDALNIAKESYKNYLKELENHSELIRSNVICGEANK